MVKPLKNAAKFLWNGTVYALSLPERYVRGLSALLGGIFKETTDILVPGVVKDTTSYNTFVGNILRFTVENVGGVKGVYDDEGLEGEFATRKLIGNAIEGVGIATIHLSPLWFFAFFADSVKGGQAYLERLHQEMVENGYIGPETSADSFTTLFEGLERTTTSFAQNIDTPPLTKDEILSNVEEIRDSISDLLFNSGSIASSTVTEMSNVLQDFMNTATDEGQSLLELGGLLTLQTTNRVKQVGGLAISAPNVAGKMLYDNILVYYSDTLTEIHEKGYANVASETIEPYGQAILDQFSTEKITWTERLFNSPASGIRKIFGMQNSK
ncbi:MAG: hypothetical protein BEU01_03075 [Marine Group III euryarchaeote CG-Epi4]|uniref:Uncharacterized protein n=1 Tax=Marine Group III euryarchaeote CG-Epi4 TaxID=1888998 RepID=A0A1J5U9V0_9ARCH|nr:MAG: hypothetical protein BEU01_03075 [Marine Group III euryarchaeote CG-Epi4]|tara:strand:- start:72 stop:1049 length:978 start_codon:yes stop_codon:yes gene_type:complete